MSTICVPSRGFEQRHERELAFLRARGAGHIEHSGAGLLAHLCGVASLLQSWSAPRHVVLAGLFHSIYGTEFLQESVVEEALRSQVRELVGENAERIAWIWCRIERASLSRNLECDGDCSATTRDGESLFLSTRDFHDLIELMLADALEQLPRRPPESLARQRSWLTPFLPRLRPALQDAAQHGFERIARLHRRDAAR